MALKIRKMNTPYPSPYGFGSHRTCAGAEQAREWTDANREIDNPGYRLSHALDGLYHFLQETLISIHFRKEHILHHLTPPSIESSTAPRGQDTLHRPSAQDAAGTSESAP